MPNNFSMRFRSGFLTLFSSFLLTANAFAQPIRSFRPMEKQDQLAEKTTGILIEVLYSTWVSFGLYASIGLLLVAIYLKLYKTAAASALTAILILAFRFLSTQLTGSYGLFQAKIIIPIFALTMLAKFVSDYIRKEKTYEEKMRDKKYQEDHKRRSVTASNKSGGKLTRFGDSLEKNNAYDKSFGSTKDSAPAAVTPKLNRNF